MNTNPQAKAKNLEDILTRRKNTAGNCHRKAPSAKGKHDTQIYNKCGFVFRGLRSWCQGENRMNIDMLASFSHILRQNAILPLKILKSIRMAILNSCLSTKNKTIITSLSPCESSISIPYTPRFREYSNGGYFYLLFFLVHCRLGSIFRAISGKNETKSWWWRASIPWICFFDAWKQPEHILPKGGFSKVIYYEINLKQIQASWVGINRSISQRFVSSNSPGHTCMSCSMSGILGETGFCQQK